MDIELITTEDLIQELTRRYDTLVLGGISSLDSAENVVMRHWSGPFASCVGLANHLSYEINRHYSSTCRKYDE